MNGVPFQRGLSMSAFLKEYGTVEQCERALEAMRWPKGDRCPICEGSRCSRYERGGWRYWQCSHCRHQTTVISGTIFEATKLPLTVGFLAMPLLTQSKNKVSALELRRHRGVSYDGLGDQAQAHAGHEGLRRGSGADGTRGNRRRLSGR